jgi:hypothetical protein
MTIDYEHAGFHQMQEVRFNLRTKSRTRKWEGEGFSHGKKAGALANIERRVYT